jgi:tripartite-type tricarboxylate transporter receptor subunit TctC
MSIQSISRRRWLGHAAAASAGLCTSPWTFAQSDWPTMPIKFIVPFAPGGGNDRFARLVSKHASDRLGQPMIMENRPGAGGLVGMQALLRAPADGYTIGLGTSTTLITTPLTSPGPTFNATKDISFIVQLAAGAYVLAVNNSVPVNSATELRKYLHDNKGKLSYGGLNVGHFNHVLPKTMSDLTDADLVFASYKGEAPAMQDLIGGQIHMALLTSGGAMAMAQAKRLKVLGVTGPKRLKTLPDVPTLAEQGWTDPVFKMNGGWAGVVAPAKTPAIILDRLASAFNYALHVAEVERELDTLGLEAIGGDRKSFEANFKQEWHVWRNVLVKAGVEVR